jgi:MoxR-like ATPase
VKFDRRPFDPDPSGVADPNGPVTFGLDDEQGRSKSLYVYDKRVIFAINVALVTRRPLLLAGEPGCGKTTLARNAARVLGWWYYEQVIGSRTQASDLLWEVDAVARLNDASDPARPLRSEFHYVQPGRLWWALAPGSATCRGLETIESDYMLTDPGQLVRRDRGRESPGAVVLLDEIDKAEPDVPNDLLEVLDTRAFRVKDLSISRTREHVLVMITTNGERELPAAFLRRCVTYRFADPTADWYVEIANRWYGAEQADLHRAIASRLMDARQQAAEAGQRQPGTAEYRDAVEASSSLGVDPGSAEWEALSRCVFEKHVVLDPTSRG